MAWSPFPESFVRTRGEQAPKPAAISHEKSCYSPWEGSTTRRRALAQSTSSAIVLGTNTVSISSRNFELVLTAGVTLVRKFEQKLVSSRDKSATPMHNTRSTPCQKAVRQAAYASYLGQRRISCRLVSMPLLVNAADCSKNQPTIPPTS